MSKQPIHPYHDPAYYRKVIGCKQSSAVSGLTFTLQDDDIVAIAQQGVLLLQLDTDAFLEWTPHHILTTAGVRINAENNTEE